MKKILLILMVLGLNSQVVADTSLDDFKKRTAKSLVDCIHNPPFDGAAAINVCYGEAADKVIKYATDKSLKAALKVKQDGGDVNGFVNDSAWFFAMIKSCEQFPAETMPFAWRITEQHVCKIRQGLSYADFFEEAQMEHSLEQTVNDLFGL